jgi:MerR family redox-sensitive transcriptional activator SoxR
MHSVLTIGEVAKRSGVAASALRFYEERGLIASFREPGKQRRYPRPVLRTIAFIVFAQRIGLSLDAIKAELQKLPGGRPPTRADWNRISKTWQSTIDARIEELQRLRGSLTECIGCGCLSLDKCHLTNASDRIARNGPGARFWIGDRRF